MKLRNTLLSGCASAALLMLAMPPAPAAVLECAPASPTEASYTWDFHKEATKLFDGVRSDARKVVDQTNYLERETSETTLIRATRGQQLARVKDAVNDMAAKLCRLTTIRRVLEPWQQQTVDRIAANLPLMVNSTDDAINYGQIHPDALWSPMYQKDVTNLHGQASSLNQSIGEAIQYAAIPNHKASS